jgi:pimeloyl-ACP methyl ester carboxylesterase
VGFIVKTVIVLSFILVFLSYFIFVYEKLSGKQGIQIKDVIITFFKEWLSYIYIFFFWIFGFLPIESYIPRRRGGVKTPTFIIPGWLHTKSVIFPLFIMMRNRGFENLFPLNAQPFTGSIEEISNFCVSKIKRTLELLADEKGEIFLIGHSLGGLVAKYITENEDEFGLKVKKCITICSPHKGTKLAYFGFGKSAKQMIPDSDFVKEYGEIRNEKRKSVYLCIGTEKDQLNIPPDTSYIDGVERITYRRHGHFSLLFSPSVADDIFSILSRIEKGEISEGEKEVKIEGEKDEKEEIQSEEKV